MNSRNEESVENELSHLADLYGYSIKEFSEDDANDLIAWEFENNANHFLKEYSGFPFTQYGSGVSIYLRFVELNSEHADSKHSLEIWTAPLYHQEHHRFAIFISMSILRGISDVQTAISADVSALTSGITERNIESKFETVIYPRIVASLIFVLLHELAHIIRAHIPFYYKERYRSPQTKSALSFHLINQNLQDAGSLSPEARIRIHRGLEIDADLLAVGLIHEFLSNQELKHPLMYLKELRKHPEIFGEAIAIVTRLLEQWRRVVSKQPYSRDESLHPHPDIRYIFFTSWLLARRKFKDRNNKFLQTTKLFEKGMNAATRKMDRFGTQFFPLFEYLEKEGKESALEEYEMIRDDLNEYVKPELQKFRV